MNAPPINSEARLETGRRNGLTNRTEYGGVDISQVETFSGKHADPIGPLPCASQPTKTSPTPGRQAKKGISYRPLDLVFRVDGFQYRQIARKGDAAVYTQRFHSNTDVCYEVVRIRRRPACILPSGGQCPAREVYPSSEQWGQDGWTLTTRDAAFAKLGELELALRLSQGSELDQIRLSPSSVPVQDPNFVPLRSKPETRLESKLELNRNSNTL
jgi:hypothetical protein